MMTLRSTAFGAASALGLALLFASAPANAQLGLVDCSAKYSAAKDSGKAGKKTFAEFQVSDCGPGAKPLPAATTPAAKAATPPAAAVTPAPAKPAAAKPEAAKPAAAATPALKSARRPAMQRLPPPPSRQAP
jgi:translation initiation factor IF-2